jgi:hypothetical protein
MPMIAWEAFQAGTDFDKTKFPTKETTIMATGAVSRRSPLVNMRHL